MWQRTYTAYNGGGGSGYGICKADGNNLYIVGYSFAPSVPFFYILKVNEYGDTIWTRIFGYGGRIYSAVSSGDGGCVFTGDWGQAFAIKMNSNGDTVWQKSYNGNRCFDIKKTNDGGYIMCGEDLSGPTISGFVCKIDSYGKSTMAKIYSNPYTIDLLGIAIAPNGGYVVVGDIFGPPVLIRNSYIIAINDTGSIIWQKKYSFGIDSYISSISFIGFSIIFGGTVQTTQNSDSTRVFVVKSNFNGDSTKSVIFRAYDFCYLPNVLTLDMNKILFTYNNAYFARNGYR